MNAPPIAPEPSVVLHRMPWSGAAGEERSTLLTREWLVTNGLGGYASGTVAGVATRRYHGLLVAALANPLGRMMVLSALAEQLRLADGTRVEFGGEERVSGKLELRGDDLLREFRLEDGLPVWRYEFGGYVLERRLWLVHRQNTVHVQYALREGPGVLRLKIRPFVHLRGHDAPVSARHPGAYALTAIDDRYELSVAPELPTLRLKQHAQRSAFTSEVRRIRELLYRVEERRGYEHEGELVSPGYSRADLSLEQPVTLVASTEQWERVLALTPDEALAAERERRRRLLVAAHPHARRGPAAELVLAADQFIITPAGRIADAARARAAGDEVRTVIAGYHWFTDWGRDTMISLEGLTLLTGRALEAGYILRTFAQYVRDGLLPNLFPEGEREGLYHTADATLWFFQALDRYARATGDEETLRVLLATMRSIVEWHRNGTHFGIHEDPSDGLLSQGAEGYQLTWMDAKVDDWVVTPRRGKAVEINALWFNAQRLLRDWERRVGDPARAEALDAHCARTYASFNARFWNGSVQHLYDVVDGPNGDDPACRPNQLFALSLEHPVLAPEYWRPVLETARRALLTPVGLRSLAPSHPDYKARYDGDLRARDAAYHQGTVWAFLVGAYVDAWLRVYPEDRAGARRALEGFESHLGEACIGSISEIFDAEAPFTPRGCIAQAWSVAEVLRAFVRTEPDADEPTPRAAT